MTEFEQKLLKWCTPHPDGTVDCIAYVHPEEPIIRLDWGTTIEIWDNPDAEWVRMAIEGNRPILITDSFHKALKSLPLVFLKPRPEY